MGSTAAEPKITENQKWRGLSASTLKLIAMAAMLVDHIGAIFLNEPGQGTIYIAFRSIGRLTFPIFCYFVVEGYFRTKDIKKYALRLLVFALVSEFPFNLAFYDRLFFLGSQNVIWTLLLGLLTVFLSEKLSDQGVLQVLPPLLFAYLAEVGQTDYGAFGIFLIYIFYISRKNRYVQAFAGGVFYTFAGLPMWPSSLIANILLLLYRGKKGLNLKYLFYIFYPAHLAVLAIVHSAL